jgi:hypothetical protein
MPNAKGYRLFVNLSASQTRHRLRHFEHGVREIQANGKNQAVITHTATGKHLDELKLQFSDVGFTTNEGKLSEPVHNLRHIGDSTAALLRDVGISTVADLARVGPIRAYQMVKEKYPKADIAMLEAMAAGLRDFGVDEVSTELD